MSTSSHSLSECVLNYSGSSFGLDKVSGKKRKHSSAVLTCWFLAEEFPDFSPYKRKAVTMTAPVTPSNDVPSTKKKVEEAEKIIQSVKSEKESTLQLESKLFAALVKD